MKPKQKKEIGNDQLNILLVGNNPIDMSRILEKINQIDGAKIMTEIAFDLKSIVERLIDFKPNFILIDDNIGRTQLSEAVDTLSHRPNTKNIPITVLKNSNYVEACASHSILDYLLKTNVTSDSLYRTVRNSIRFKRTQMFLTKVYGKRKNVLSGTYA
jgi:DNA-binding NarL/FixJ family response regulator